MTCRRFVRTSSKEGAILFVGTYNTGCLVVGYLKGLLNRVLSDTNRPSKYFLYITDKIYLYVNL